MSTCPTCGRAQDRAPDWYPPHDRDLAEANSGRLMVYVAERSGWSIWGGSFLKTIPREGFKALYRRDGLPYVAAS